MIALTLDNLIASSTEFVCETWGQGEASVAFYAPITRDNGVTWLHPTWAREATWVDIRERATRIWRVRGSLWNPRGFVLMWSSDCEALSPITNHGRNRNV